MNLLSARRNKPWTVFSGPRWMCLCWAPILSKRWMRRVKARGHWVDAWLKQHLVCPREHYTLELRDNLLVCPRGHKYPYLDGIPVMLLEEAKPTHGDCCKTLEQTAGNRVLSLRDDETEILDGGVDPYVQEVVA